MTKAAMTTNARLPQMIATMAPTEKEMLRPK